MKGKNQIDLGLAISGLSSKQGVPKTHREIAAYCIWNPTTKKWGTVSWQRIWQIEQRALRKIRIRLRYLKDPVVNELIKHLERR